MNKNEKDQLLSSLKNYMSRLTSCADSPKMFSSVNIKKIAVGLNYKFDRYVREDNLSGLEELRFILDNVFSVKFRVINAGSFAGTQYYSDYGFYDNVSLVSKCAFKEYVNAAYRQFKLERNQELAHAKMVKETIQ